MKLVLPVRTTLTRTFPAASLTAMASVAKPTTASRSRMVITISFVPYKEVLTGLENETWKVLLLFTSGLAVIGTVIV